MELKLGVVKTIRKQQTYVSSTGHSTNIVWDNTQGQDTSYLDHNANQTSRYSSNKEEMGLGLKCSELNRTPVDK